MSISFNSSKRNLEIEHATFSETKKRRLICPFYNKKPALIPEYEGEKRRLFIFINSSKYEINQLGKGEFHTVYSFKTTPGNDQLSINKKVIDLSNSILKVTNGDLVHNKLKKQHMRDVAAYKRLIDLQVPTPKVYVTPEDFEDTTDPNNGGFWIIKKLQNEIKPDINTPETFAFVKEWITKCVKEDKILIPDFYPRNVMLDNEKNHYIVDFDLPEEEDDILGVLPGALNEWANNDLEIVEKLCEDLGEHKNDLISLCKYKLESKDNASKKKLHKLSIPIITPTSVSTLSASAMPFSLPKPAFPLFSEVKPFEESKK